MFLSSISLFLRLLLILAFLYFLFYFIVFWLLLFNWVFLLLYCWCVFLGLLFNLDFHFDVRIIFWLGLRASLLFGALFLFKNFSFLFLLRFDFGWRFNIIRISTKQAFLINFTIKFNDLKSVMIPNQPCCFVGPILTQEEKVNIMRNHKLATHQTNHHTRSTSRVVILGKKF